MVNYYSIAVYTNLDVVFSLFDVVNNLVRHKNRCLCLYESGCVACNTYSTIMEDGSFFLVFVLFCFVCFASAINSGGT